MGILLAIFLLLPKGIEIGRATLSNGIPLLIVRVERIPTTSLTILIKGGVRKLRKGEDGLELLSFKCALEGSRTYPYPEFQRMASQNGIEFKVQSLPDFTTVTMKCLNEFLNTGISLLSSALAEPELRRESFEKIRGSLISEAKRREENPDEKVWDMVDSRFYKDHPYRTKPLGKEETLRKFTVEEVRNYLKEHIRSGEILIGICGDINFDDAEGILEQNFSWIRNDTFTDPLPPRFRPPHEDTLIRMKMEVNTSYLAGKFQAPSPAERDFVPTLVAMRILSYRLSDKIRTGYGLSYATYAGLSSKLRNYGYLYFSSGDYKRALKLLMEEIESLKKVEITYEEIRNAVYRFKTARWLRACSSDALLSGLLLFEYLGKGAEEYFTLVDEAEELTPEKIAQVVSQYCKNIVFALITRN